MRSTSTCGWRRTSSATIGTTVHPRSCRAASFSRSRRSASAPACHSSLSYSAATLFSGQAKSRRRSLPRASMTSCWSTGVGSPPSIITSRASLSIGDSALPSAIASSRRTFTIPRRPACAAAAQCRAHGSQVRDRRAASRVASDRLRGNARATSIAVQAAVVAGRPPSDVSGAPSRRCTTRPSVGRIWCPPDGLSTCNSVVFSVSNPKAWAAVPRQIANASPQARSRPRSNCSASLPPTL